MPFNADPVTLTLLLLLAAIVVGVAVFVAKGRMKARREEKSSAAVTAAIRDYFRRSGVEVSVSCARLSPGGRFTALLESEPMKRFRLSHIIEMAVRDHVRKTCGLELDKVYWRFPVKEVAQAAAASGAAEAAKPAESADEYINEGLEHYKYIPKVEATELSWEHFEQVATTDPAKKADPQDGQRAG